jgi:hypothetical protein
MLPRRGYATAALALTGGTLRKLIATRFQALMVAISNGQIGGLGFRCPPRKRPFAFIWKGCSSIVVPGVHRRTRIPRHIR